MKLIHEYLPGLYHPDGSPAIIAKDKVKEARELPGGCVELIELGGRRHVVKAAGTAKADRSKKRELLALWDPGN